MCCCSEGALAQEVRSPKPPASELFPATPSSVALKALRHNTTSLHAFVLCFEICSRGVCEHVPHRLTGIRMLGSQLVMLSEERWVWVFVAALRLRFAPPPSIEDVVLSAPRRFWLHACCLLLCLPCHEGPLLPHIICQPNLLSLTSHWSCT